MVFTACCLKATACVAKTPILGTCIRCPYVIGNLHRERLRQGLIPRTSGRNLRLRFDKIRIVGQEAHALATGKLQVQSLAPRRQRHPALLAEPDGKCNLPAINPGGFSLPGFFL